MPCVKLTKEKVAAIYALRKCKPPVSYSAIGRVFGMDHSSISNVLKGKTKTEYPGENDKSRIAQQLRELASKIESGEISIN